MQRGLSRLLRDGISHVNPDLSITVTAPDGSVLHSIPPTALATGGIGYVYERVVALDYLLPRKAPSKRWVCEANL